MSGSSSFRESVKDVVASIAGAASCCYIGAPFDTVKVRMQARPNEFTGLWQGILRTVAHEGVAALWKGSTATLSGMVMENAVAFGMMEHLKRIFPAPEEESGRLRRIVHPMLVGAFTGVICAVVLCPSENMKVKCQHTVSGTTSAVEAFRAIVKRQGIVRGMFTGLDAQMLRDGSFYMVFFGSYDFVKQGFLQTGASQPVAALAAGGMAGMIGWAVVMPLDVPKSVIQSRWSAQVVGDFFPTMQRIMRARGFRGLYAGLGPSLIRSFPANAALFVGYEGFRSLIVDV